MSASGPLVTVGMATYNGADHIAKSLKSILDSSYSNIDLLIVDDGSTDNSVEIARRADDCRIRIISNKSNRGLVSTRQQIMQEARGTYLAWLDQDDIAYPNRIASQVAFLERNEKVGACGSGTKHRFSQTSGLEALYKQFSVGGHSEIHASMPFTNPISFNTATMRLSAFRHNNLEFREKFGNTLDYDMWSRASDVMELRNIQKFLGEYRFHPGQTSRGPALESMLQAGWIVQCEVLERHLGVLIDANSDHVHRRITLTPQTFLSESDVIEAGTWLRFLMDQNRVTRAYDQRAFDNAASRQWVICLYYLSRAVGRTKALKLAGASRSITGLATSNLAHSVKAVLKNRKSAMVRK
jgi:glycosyltransferase involved in cell wall biosynthesis